MKKGLNILLNRQNHVAMMMMVPAVNLNSWRCVGYKLRGMRGNREVQGIHVMRVFARGLQFVRNARPRLSRLFISWFNRFRTFKNTIRNAYVSNSEYPGEFWKKFHCLLPRKDRGNSHIQLIEDGRLITDSIDVANLLKHRHAKRAGVIFCE